MIAIWRRFPDPSFVFVFVSFRPLKTRQQDPALGDKQNSQEARCQLLGQNATILFFSWWQLSPYASLRRGLLTCHFGNDKNLWQKAREGKREGKGELRMQKWRTSHSPWSTHSVFSTKHCLVLLPCRSLCPLSLLQHLCSLLRVCVMRKHWFPFQPMLIACSAVSVLLHLASSKSYAVHLGGILHS